MSLPPYYLTIIHDILIKVNLFTNEKVTKYCINIIHIMPKSIKVTATKSRKEDQWPIFFEEEMVKNKNILQKIGVHSYILSNMVNYYDTNTGLWLNNFSNLLLISNHYYFSTDELFSRYKDMVYNYIPLYKTAFSDNELLEYYSLNNIDVTIEEIDNPDLTGYVFEW